MNKSSIRLTAAAVAVAACATLPFAAPAADLTVAQGQSQTLSNGDSYDAVVVNGNLTIPANAAVSAASLTVADGAYDATVTLEPGPGSRSPVTSTSATTAARRMSTSTPAPA